ncbi:MAG: SulP family inorganic anion transporter [Saprospiraceae bacterium]
MNFQIRDVFGGLTAGIVALPLALAFGVQSGMGPAAGLYGAIILGFFAAALGGTPTQISGPTGPMVVVTTATVAAFVDVFGSLEAAMGAIVLTFILSGVIQIAFGILRLGVYIRYIPYPVISGFMSGIGLIIIILQIFPALGHPPPPGTEETLAQIAKPFAEMNVAALGLSSLSIAIIYLFPRITKKIPGTLIALVAVTGLSIVIDADVPRIGDIPSGFPEFKAMEIFHLSAHNLHIILSTAITLAALGSIDSLLTSVVADNVTKTRHNSNRELIGQGVGNALGGLFAGLPGAGATMRTLVNIRAGGTGRLSGIVHSLTLVAILLGAGQYAALIPQPVLAGILITVGIGILDYKGFRHLAKVPKSDAIIMVTVLILTVFVDLLTAVGAGMLIATVLFTKRMSELVEEQTKVGPPGTILPEKSWPDEVIPENLKDNILIKHLDGPLFFGFANKFLQLASALPSTKYLIIRMGRVPYLDQSGLYALEDAILSMEQRGIEVLVTGLQTQPRVLMERVRMIPDLIEPDNIFQDFESCINWLKQQQID